MSEYVVRRRRLSGEDDESVYDLITEYEMTDAALKKLQSRRDVLNARLKDIAEESGRPDNKGSLWRSVPPPEHSGRPGELYHRNIKREKRTTMSLDPDAAQEWAERRGLWHTKEGGVATEVTMFDEEKLLAVKFMAVRDLDGPDEDAASLAAMLVREIDDLYTETVTWSLKIVEGPAPDLDEPDAVAPDEDMPEVEMWDRE